MIDLKDLNMAEWYTYSAAALVLNTSEQAIKNSLQNIDLNSLDFAVVYDDDDDTFCIIVT